MLEEKNQSDKIEKPKKKRKTKNLKIKAINVLVSPEDWKFVRLTAISQDLSMAEFISKCINRYRKHLEKKSQNVLTKDE